MDNVEIVLGRVTNPPPVGTPTIEDAYKTSVLITDVLITDEEMELVKIACVESSGGMTLVVASEATVDVNCEVLTEFPPVMLDTDRNFVKTFCVES
jgi:hypothetical protein